MSTRRKTLAVLTAALAVSSAASAQTYTFTQTELGRIVPARFATTTQALMANVDLAVAPTIVPEAVATNAADTDTKVSIASDEISTWNAVAAIDSDDEKKEENSDEPGFFGSTMGRASIVGLAGLAGASYFALRSESPVSAPRDQAVFDAATVTPTFTENPEPATIILMGTGLLGLGVVARRRRAN